MFSGSQGRRLLGLIATSALLLVGNGCNGGASGAHNPTIVVDAGGEEAGTMADGGLGGSTDRGGPGGTGAVAKSDAGDGSDASDAVERIAFSLPSKTYAFDTASWSLPSAALPAVTCDPDQIVVDCCNPPAPLQKPDCSVNAQSCDDRLCKLHVAVSLAQTMDLRTETPALSSYSSQSPIAFGITTVKYAFTSSMNIDLPRVDLYLAPVGVKSASDPRAQKFGTTMTMLAGSTGEDMVGLTPNADVLFALYADQFGIPFNMIATTTVVVPSGSPIPEGRVTLIVQGTAIATL